jgi:hypothetical protein
LVLRAVLALQKARGVMTWTKIPDDANETFWTLSADALRLHLFALVYCNRMLTDGFVPAARLATLTPNYQPAHLAELVAAGLWEAVDGGHKLLRFLDEQIPRAKVLAKRERDRADVAAWRARNPTSKTPGKTLTPGVVNDVEIPVPVPGVRRLHKDDDDRSSEAYEATSCRLCHGPAIEGNPFVEQSMGRPKHRFSPCPPIGVTP